MTCTDFIKLHIHIIASYVPQFYLNLLAMYVAIKQYVNIFV